MDSALNGQIDILELINFKQSRFIIDKKVRLIELFAGIGSQASALDILGVDFEHHKIAEWEVNAIKSYRAIHKCEDKEYLPFVNYHEELFKLGI